MFRNILVTYFIVASACAMHLEYLKVDSDELPDGTLFSATSNDSVDQDQDLLMAEEQIFGMCSFCTGIMKKVKRHLGKHENVEKIKEQLMGYCDKSKILAIVKKCKKMVTKKIDMFVKELSTNDDPKTICAKAHLCKLPSEPKLIQAILQNFQTL